MSAAVWMQVDTVLLQFFSFLFFLFWGGLFFFFFFFFFFLCSEINLYFVWPQRRALVTCTKT